MASVLIPARKVRGFEESVLAASRMFSKAAVVAFKFDPRTSSFTSGEVVPMPSWPVLVIFNAARALLPVLT